MDHEDKLLCPKTVDEAQTHNSSSNGRDTAQNGANGRHQKKKKKKEREKPVKIQQRGLGVAELEKRRKLEEHKNRGVEISSSSSSPVNRVLVAPPHRADHSYNRSGSAPLQPPFVSNTQTLHPSDNYYLYRTGDPPHLNIGHQTSRGLNNAGTGIGCPTSFFAKEGNGSNNKSCVFENTHQELEISTRPLHKVSSTNGPMQPSSFPMQLGNQHSYFYTPSTVNHVAGNSLSAVSNIQTELPSNQSLCGTHRSVQPDEAEKNVATKWQHMLSPYDLPDSISRGKFNPFMMASRGLERSVSLRTQGQGSSATNGTPTPREGLLSAVSLPNLQQQRKDTKTDSDGQGPQATMLLLSSLKHEEPLSHQAELPSLESTIYQVQAQGSNMQRGSNMSTNHHQQQQEPDNMFLPAYNNDQNAQSILSSNLNNNNNGDTEDNLDLSLKL